MIEMVIHQRRRSLGGFDVRRILPFAKRRMVGPFVFLDHMGPLDLAPGVSRSVDVWPHPHIGLSIVTYLCSGEIMHRDSVGSEQAIRPGEVNWMVAGRGITHSERFEKARAEGDHLHGIQAWVALPEADEEVDPAFTHHGGDHLPVWQDGGISGRMIAGSAFGLTARVRTHSPLFYAHLDMADGARVIVPENFPERAAYVASGAIECEGQRLEMGAMLVHAQGTANIAASEPATVMLLGGEPLGTSSLLRKSGSNKRRPIGRRGG